MITVEDFNSVLQEYGSSNIYHCIDTSLISEDYDYDGIKYDFCIVERETTNTDEYTFKINVVNKAWTGGYYILDSDDEYVDDATASYNSTNGVITIVTDHPTIKLHLYINNYCTLFKFEQLNYILLSKNTRSIKSNIRSSLENPFLQFKLLNGSMPETLTIRNTNNETGTVTVKNVEGNIYQSSHVYNWHYSGAMRLEDDNSNYLYFYNTVVTVQLPIYNSSSYLPKSNNSYSLIKGKRNKVIYCISSAEYEIESGVCTFNSTTVPIDVELMFDGYTMLTFYLDLTNYSKNTAKFHLELNPNGDFYGLSYDLSMPCVNASVTNIASLVSECGNGGATYVELTGGGTLTDDLVVTHDIVINGISDVVIDLDGHSIIVSDGVKLELSNCALVNGDNAIVQKVNSELIINNVSFSNCVSSEFSNLGSCIYCDIDLNSLSVEDDFKTTLTGCEFYDNHNAIFHGGNLIIDGCKLHNTDLDYLDKHNVALLYQTDGTATIKNSILDIDYTDTSLCTNEESIGFAQALFQCGETAKINNQTFTDMKNNGFDFTGNASHIFVKYYYATLSECVFTSPILGREDKAFCYCLSGLNKIFKENVQITKASDNAENTNRKIEW